MSDTRKDILNSMNTLARVDPKKSGPVKGKMARTGKPKDNDDGAKAWDTEAVKVGKIERTGFNTGGKSAPSPKSKAVD